MAIFLLIYIMNFSHNIPRFSYHLYYAFVFILISLFYFYFHSFLLICFYFSSVFFQRYNFPDFILPNSLHLLHVSPNFLLSSFYYFAFPPFFLPFCLLIFSHSFLCHYLPLFNFLTKKGFLVTKWRHRIPISFPTNFFYIS